jgi:hypothetical protein
MPLRIHALRRWWPLLPAVVLATASACAAELSLPQANSLTVPPAASGALNEYNFNASADGRTLVFARSEAEFQNARILISQRTAEGWTAPEPIGFTDARYSDSDPWLTPDGQTLFFISNRPTPTRSDHRDYDIWRSVRTTEGWSAPQHLGDTVNSPGQELGPEVHGGRLYFASARSGGAGGLDIWSAAATGDGYGAPERLPAPINSAESESDFTLTPDGNVALFWRMVDGQGLIQAARRSPDGRWEAPRPLPSTVNQGRFNFTPQLSPDGGVLWFATTVQRDGQADGLADVREVAAASLF